MRDVQVPLPVGSVLQGHYLIESLLGKGCSGAVYLVSDQRIKHTPPRQMALKEVVAFNKGERSRLIFEGASLRRLRNQAFPRIYHVFNDGNYGRMYMLMEYIEGTSLEALLHQRPERRFSWLEAVPLMAPVIDAVSYLHAQRPIILHRDIKPANIIVSEARTVLVDFGMTEKYDPGVPSVAAPSCASAYRPPEQYSGGIDTRTDVYALGATFYTLVTGKVPVDSLSRMAHVGKGELDPLRPANEVIPAVPAHVAEVIDQAMSLHPYERFSAVERFWEALWESVNVFPVELPSPMPTTTPPVSSRRPAIYGSASAVENSIATPLRKQPQVKHLPLFVSVRLGVLDLLAQVGRFWEVLGSRKRRRSPLFSTPSATSPRLDVFRPESSVVQPPTEAIPVHPPRAPSVWKPGIVLVFVALLIGLGVVAGFLSHVPNHTDVPLPAVTAPASGPTHVPSAVPTVSPLRVGTYTGTIDDLSSNVSTSISLTGVRQSQGKISGYLMLGSGLQGSGPFSGTIDTAKHFQFTVTDAAGRATLFFEGVMQSTISLSGDYYECRPNPAQNGQCSRAPGGYGIWSAVLVS